MLLLVVHFENNVTGSNEMIESQEHFMHGKITIKNLDVCVESFPS